jgi:TRAP-type C4-dicarboxylate transport system permease small subunit
VKKIVDVLVKIQLIAAIVCLVTFVAAVILQVATRYIPGFSWLWTEQIANYSFIWSVLMGAAVGVRRKDHFFLSVLTDRLKGKTAWVDSVLVQVLIGLFGVFLLVHGVTLTMSFWGWSLTALPQFRQGWFWLALPICGATISIYAFYNVYELRLEKRSIESSLRREGRPA